jgi:hypothetical protein
MHSVRCLCGGRRGKLQQGTCTPASRATLTPLLRCSKRSAHETAGIQLCFYDSFLLRRSKLPPIIPRCNRLRMSKCCRYQFQSLGSCLLSGNRWACGRRGGGGCGCCECPWLTSAHAGSFYARWKGQVPLDTRFVSCRNPCRNHVCSAHTPMLTRAILQATATVQPARLCSRRRPGQSAQCDPPPPCPYAFFAA